MSATGGPLVGLWRHTAYQKEGTPNRKIEVVLMEEPCLCDTISSVRVSYLQLLLLEV